MALCPVCQNQVSWWKVLFLHRWNFTICKTCGTALQTNKKRALTILVFFSIPPIIAAYMRDIGLLSRNDMIPLLVFWMFLLPFAWDFFTKLEANAINLRSQTSSDEAIAYYNQGNYDKALKVYRSAAEQGDVNAQFSLGWMYATGQGVQQDYQQALQWYLKAAEQGDAVAQYNLGWMYYQGQGVQQDYEQAAHWLQKAAEQGAPDAQYNLGVMYSKGLGVQQDDQQAIQWWRKSAQQGYESAIKALNIQASSSALEPSTNRVPGETTANEELQLDIVRSIAFQEGLRGGNKGGRVLNTRRLSASRELIPEESRELLDMIIDIAAKNGRSETYWCREEWLIDRNGVDIYYEILLIESPVEGTDIRFGRVQETPFSI